MLETADLILHPGVPEDGPALHANLWRHASVFQYLFSRPSSDEVAGIQRTAAYAGMHQEVSTEFFVCEKTTGQPIGIAGVKELTPGHWTITDVAIGPDYQRKGYGVQIIRALAELAFSRGAQEVAYECFAENEASKRLAQHCGFMFSHAVAAELPKNGQPVTLAHYILRKPEFPSYKENPS